MNTIEHIIGNPYFYVGIVSTIIFFIIYEVVSKIIKGRIQRKLMRNKDLIRYNRCHMEKEWIGMLDICREIFSLDANMFKKIADLIGACPHMSSEELQAELEHFGDLEKIIRIRADERQRSADILTQTVTRDQQYISDEIEDIRQKWPKFIAEYDKQTEERLANGERNKNTNGQDNA